MTWDEWEHLKSDAAARGSAQMQLNRHPADQGGGPAPGSASASASGNLKSNKKAWVKAGEGVKGLMDGVGKALTKLSEGQAGLGDTGECRSAAAQKDLYESWRKYVGDVSSRCDGLGGLLEGAGHDLSKSDQTVREELDKLQLKYQDTVTVGGHTKEK
ncbi:hypothetical protein ACFC5Z_33910 [Streptomyces sp. NPDC056004]|uniref:hypothetical protein n=1 Tax=Streptomyces sp. NPDC056004 TaxID=3345677 RepID=UPI0035D625C9